MSRLLAGGTLLGLLALAAGCAHPTAPEDILVLRSIREPAAVDSSWCSPPRSGFQAFAADGDRTFSFWSVQVRAPDGRVIETRSARVAGLHGCFGPTSEPARQNFYAEISLEGMLLRGNGECLALQIDFPEPGLYPVRCQIVLRDTPAPFIGGLLTTNTITSRENFGGDTEPPGYTQASIATLRLWKARSSPQASTQELP